MAMSLEKAEIFSVISLVLPVMLNPQLHLIHYGYNGYTAMTYLPGRCLVKWDKSCKDEVASVYLTL